MHHAHQGADGEDVAQRDPDVVPQLQDRGVPGGTSLSAATSPPASASPPVARSVTQASHPSGRVGRDRGWGRGCSMSATLAAAPAATTSLGAHEHPHRRRARPDRSHRPAARRPAAGEVDRGDLPRRRHLLHRGARHARLHRHLAGPPGLGAGLRHGPALDVDLRQRAVLGVRRAAGRARRVLRRADREPGDPRRGDRLGRLHRLLDEPAALPRPRLRPGGRLRAAPGGGRGGRGARPT